MNITVQAAPRMLQDATGRSYYLRAHIRTPRGSYVAVTQAWRTVAEAQDQLDAHVQRIPDALRALEEAERKHREGGEVPRRVYTVTQKNGPALSASERSEPRSVLGLVSG